MSGKTSNMNSLQEQQQKEIYKLLTGTQQPSSPNSMILLQIFRQKKSKKNKK